MNKNIPTDFERHLGASVENRRGVRQEQLILRITETLAQAMNQRGMKKADVARELGVTPAFVTQVLSGGRNLTLRTVSDLSDALGGELKVWFRFHDYAYTRGGKGWRACRTCRLAANIPRKRRHRAVVRAISAGAER